MSLTFPLLALKHKKYGSLKGAKVLIGKMLSPKNDLHGLNRNTRKSTDFEKRPRAIHSRCLRALDVLKVLRKFLQKNVVQKQRRRCSPFGRVKTDRSRVASPSDVRPSVRFLRGATSSRRTLTSKIISSEVRLILPCPWARVLV